MRTSPTLLLAVICGAGLCVGSPLVFAAQQPPAFTRKDAKPVVPYRITRNDVLSVQIFGEPDLTAGNRRVESRGTISLTLVGDIRVLGLTPAEAARTIETAYRDGRILRNPDVTVTVEQYAPRRITVTGKVKMPQLVDLPPEEQWTIRDVITKVGGFDDTAKGTAVRLMRMMPDGTTKVFTLDVQSALLGKDKATTSADASFPVEPDDVIYVPEKMI